ncbi:MAG: glutamate 5-kinase [Gammaproteobacteria bacterium]|nr:glutamate 5-kinase [Gammaproteobacteria bacterium]MDE0280694.1 glutamate 5-kinase [Gammaproteobacteria bacterium]MDE0714107.1 glutamate 5-kinase [Gammaproteobacteria bacterium]MXX16085.1 glutamate 5-kinase [Gammaproteobacteria bacterium]MXY65319.1 glutamate 5-kinase [Gammaproteobacteria bacterium]
MGERRRLTRNGRWVVKIGTSLLTDMDNGLDQSAIDDWVRQIAALKQEGMHIVLVSSGSIGVGVQRLGWNARPREIHQLQAAAAVGQMGLVQAYEGAFKQFGILTAQVLLTHADLANRERYLNARSTLRALLKLGAVPVVNENDTVVNDEIRFGDNDTLAALVANLVEADSLLILTDQEGLFDSDPRSNPDARLIGEGSVDDPSLARHAGPAQGFGRGGMLTKVGAARKAARSGAATVIAGGRTPDVLLRLHAGEELGTYLRPGNSRMVARKQWLAGQLRGNGRLVLDDGAVHVLRESGRSLLPIGVKEVSGLFGRGEIVLCVDLEGREVARGLVNYSAVEASRIAGKPSDQIETILGYAGEIEMIHRDNIALSD